MLIAARLGGLRFQRQMHPFMSAVLLGVARRDALEGNAEPQPPDGELAEPVERVRRREGHAVVGPDCVRQDAVLKGALKDGERVPFLRR